MDSKSLTLLTFVLGHTVSFNITSEGTLYNQISDKIFRKVFTDDTGTRITQYLSTGDLKNISIDSAMANAANFELNRRSKILHYRNGKINPPFLANLFERRSQSNDTDIYESEYYWSEYTAILFGEENPIRLVKMPDICSVYVISYRNHLKLLSSFTYDKFLLEELKESSMNGVIFPSLRISRFLSINLYISQIQLYRKNSNDYRENENNGMKLIIMIASNNEIIDENQILMEVGKIRKTVNSNAPICFISQLDTRDKDEEENSFIVDGLMLVFHGSDIQTSVLVVNTKNGEALKRGFEAWKKELNFLDSHQVIAFHFTMLNGTEPENCEEIFSNTFKNIPLSTLRLLGGPSIIGVNYQTEMESNFKVGPIFALVGIRKFGY